MPTTPQKLAGFRSDPPMSLPSAIGSIPVASATAAPPLLPPQVLLWSYGFSVDAEHRVEGLRTGAELRRVRLADNNRAGATESLDCRRVLVRHELLEERRPERRPDPLRRLEILVRDRQAVERPDVAAVCELFIGKTGARHRLIGNQRHDCIDIGIHALDLHQVRADDLACGQLLRTNQARELDGA